MTRRPGEDSFPEEGSKQAFQDHCRGLGGTGDTLRLKAWIGHGLALDEGETPVQVRLVI